MMPRQRHPHRSQNFVLSCSQYLPAKKQLLHVSRTPPKSWLSIKTGCDWLVSFLYLRTNMIPRRSPNPLFLAASMRVSRLPLRRSPAGTPVYAAALQQPVPSPPLESGPSRSDLSSLLPFSPLHAGGRSFTRLSSVGIYTRFPCSSSFRVCALTVFFGQTDCTDGGFLCEIYESALFESGVG